MRVSVMIWWEYAECLEGGPGSFIKEPSRGGRAYVLNNIFPLKKNSLLVTQTRGCLETAIIFPYYKLFFHKPTKIYQKPHTRARVDKSQNIAKILIKLPFFAQIVFDLWIVRKVILFLYFKLILNFKIYELFWNV